ncbi:hypothetical protein GGX14DRAFT_621464 [Mycena pura]|uniref:Uncharacterized protein n=1 Tax=Mycena pura TaxID=153505 RepID=A0AAD6VNI5_9AGAR|nr:hypothetical protein GGX14DRAFT_621464 [Mycena pura]
MEAFVDLLKRTNAPVVPPEIEVLTTPEYADVARAYIESYEFPKCSSIDNPYGASESPQALADIRRRYKTVLTGFVDLDRGMFQSVDPTVNPTAARRAFILHEIFEKRDALEKQGSRYFSLIETILTWTPSAYDIFENDATCAVMNVSPLVWCIYLYPNGCVPLTMDEDEYDPDAIEASLGVVHILPYAAGTGAWPMLARVTGMSIKDWDADHESNAILLHDALNRAFSGFRIYFEQNTKNEIVIRFRTEPLYANPIRTFRPMYSPRRDFRCPLAEDGEALLAVADPGIPDLDPKFCLVHKALGDIFWMLAAVEPEIVRWYWEDLNLKSMNTTVYGLVLEGHEQESDTEW